MTKKNQYSSKKKDVIERNINRDLAELDKWSQKWLQILTLRKQKLYALAPKNLQNDRL